MSKFSIGNKFSVGDRVVYLSDDNELEKNNVYIVRLVINDFIFLNKLDSFIYIGYYDNRIISLQESRRLKLKKLGI
jgi:hypothetical protein